MSRSPVITALIDANVLYPAPLRDYLLHLASLGVYEPLWTDAIQEEWIRNLLASRSDLRRESLESTRRAMNKAFPGANVSNYESLIETLTLPDPDDRHVLAAAIKGNAQVIITANLKDFPLKNLNPHSVRAVHPDQFISDCIDRSQANALKALENQVKALKNPPMSREMVLKNLETSGLITSATRLRQ